MDLTLLITKCLQNNRKAQFALFDKYVDQVSKICERYTNDLPSAKDSVQTTFIKVFKKLDTFDSSKGNFGGWISRIAINECLMRYRKNKHLTFVETEDLPIEKNVLIPNYGADIDYERLIRIVEKLPIGYRTVFMLSVIDGFSHQEIGEQLDISESTSRSQLYKARKMLIKRIGQLPNLNKVC